MEPAGRIHAGVPPAGAEGLPRTGRRRAAEVGHRECGEGVGGGAGGVERCYFE